MSRRQNDDHKFTVAFGCDKFRPHLLKMHARRWKKYQQLEVQEKVKYFKTYLLYVGTIDSHFGSTDFRTYSISQDVIHKVVIPFLCDDSMMEGNLGSYKLAVQHGKTFDLVIGYVTAGISFCQVATAMSVSSTSGVGPRLLRVNEKLFCRDEQAIIGIDKVRRFIPLEKVRAYSVAFDLATNRRDSYLHVRVRA